MNIKSIGGLRAPLIYRSEHKKYYLPITYLLNKPNKKLDTLDVYNPKSEHYYITNPLDHFQNGILQPYSAWYSKSHAYGLLFNAARTNILPIDIDTATEDDITALVLDLAQLPQVIGIDIASSTRDTQNNPLKWHVYAALNAEYSALTFYREPPAIACKAFCDVICSRHSIVIRTSKKFNVKEQNEKIKTTVRWEYGLDRSKKETWLKYSSGQLIAPLRIADGLFFSMTRPQKRNVLRLRG